LVLDSILMFIGYIDDSGSTESHLVTLSCLVGYAPTWQKVEQAWLDCLDKKNTQLKRAGRTEMRRYHAADCSQYYGDFKDWKPDEQREFTSCLIKVFQDYPLAVSSYTLNLKDLIAEFPEAKDDSYGATALAQIILFTHIVVFIADKVLSDPRYVDDQITLIHDRSDYNAVLAEAFKHLKNDESFIHRDRFTTISPMGWETCVPLQPADLIAYENFKIVEREAAGVKRRKSMELILNLDSFAGRGVKLKPEAFKEIRRKHTDESVRILFENARIRPSQQTNNKVAKHPEQPEPPENT
jgi:hypothetical protein